MCNCIRLLSQSSFEDAEMLVMVENCRGSRRFKTTGFAASTGSKKADQNTGGALLEFAMRTAMHGKSRVSSAISVCDN